MLDMPVPGSFRKIGHQIEANKAQTMRNHETVQERSNGGYL